MTSYVAPNGEEVVKVLEVISATFAISGIGEDGSPEYEDGAEADVDWDSQKPVKRNGHHVYLTDDGSEWTFDQLTAVEDDDEDDDGDDEEDAEA